MNFTPGPWTFVRASGQWVIIPEGSMEVIARVVGGELDFTRRKGNARLIAKAPDLLEACEGLIAAIRQGQALASADGSMSLPLQRALEATAKARGGTR